MKTIETFYKLGKEAYAKDESSAPALNKQVIEAISQNEVGNPLNIQIMKSFSKGWTDANVADNSWMGAEA